MGFAVRVFNFFALSLLVWSAVSPAVETISVKPDKLDVLRKRYGLTAFDAIPNIGKSLKSVEGTVGSYTFDGTELYVRGVVTASTLHPNPSQVGEFERAWVQPMVVAVAAGGR